MKLTEKENLRRIHRREVPEWIPQNFAAVQLFCPSCYLPHGTPGLGGTDLFGAKWIVESNAPTGAIPDPRFHIIPDVEDLPNWRDFLTLPDVDAMDWAAAAQRDCAGFDRENKMLCTDVMDGNFNRLQAIMGTCEALIAMLEEPEAVLDFFDYHTNLKIMMLDKIMEHYHPDIIINGDDVCSSDGLFFSRELYDTFIKPFEQRFADAVKSYGVVLQHHVCGKCEDIIPDIIGYGTDVIETMQPGMNDIVKMKQLYGDKVIFNGGWDSYGPHNKATASEEEIRAEVRRIVDEYCYDGSFIIYGGILIDTSNGWDRFNEMNDWVFDETKKYSSAYLRKKFG